MFGINTSHASSSKPRSKEAILVRKALCKLGVHDWIPAGEELWYSHFHKKISYSEAQCAVCPVHQVKPTVFPLTSVPPRPM